MTLDEVLAENKQLRAENAALKQQLADLEAVV
jgi:regulator of replication initiation timing